LIECRDAGAKFGCLGSGIDERNEQPEATQPVLVGPFMREGHIAHQLVLGRCAARLS
jgi:hypothetical protein